MFDDGLIRDKHKIGWIAQGVLKVLPKAVDQSKLQGLTDCLTLNTDLIYATMYGAIQKIQNIVKSQETQTTNQETNINTYTIFYFQLY
jgi:hypothetical protein